MWIVAGLLAAAFTAGGTSLLLMSRERYRALGDSQRWIDDFGDGHLKFIGTVKIIGCLGLILPGALGIAPVLTPLAACGMVMFTTGAATTRFRRSEWKLLGPDLLYLSLFAFVAWGRFDLQPF
nr:DoxX family protein [Nocardioides panzhihuensis]